MGFLLLEDTKFSQIYCLTNTFLQLSSYTLRVITFNVKLFKRAYFSISGLVHIRFLMHLFHFS